MNWDYVDLGAFRDWLYQATTYYKARINAQEPEIRAINGLFDDLINLATIDQEQALALKHADPLYREPTCCQHPEVSHE